MNDQSSNGNDGVSPPAWIEALVETVSACIEAHNLVGPLEYWYSTEEEMTELIVYPLPVELVGGAVDGAIVGSEFSLDVHTLQTNFEQIDAIYWQAHSFGSHDLDGPHLSFEGTYQGHQVWLRVLSDPPEDAEPGLRFDTSE